MKSNNERIHYINLSQQSVKEDYEVIKKYLPWRGRKKLFSSIRIDIDFLMFRINNSRTMKQQIAYKKKHLECPDLFNDPESEITQNAQEEILNKLLDRSGEPFIRDLVNRGQEDPAVITYEGFVVNGNRRLAALRRINEKYMDCFVLPRDANESDFYEIEQVFQLSKDFKEDYDWINELSNIHNGVYLYSKSIEDMAERLRIKDTEVNAQLRMFGLIKEFLKWKGIPNSFDYPILDDKEQIFIELEKETRKTKKYSPDQIEEIKQLTYTLIENPVGSGRLYKTIRDLYRNYLKIRDSLIVKKEVILVADDQTDKGKDNGEMSILDDLINEQEYQVESFRLNPGDSEINSTVITETVNDVLAEVKDVKKAESVYSSVSDALRSLTGLIILKDNIRLDEAKAKLLQIVKIANSLIKQIDNRNEKSVD